MRKEDFIRLVDRYLDGTADSGERLLVEEYYNRLAVMEPVSYLDPVKKFYPGHAALVEPVSWSILFENKLTMLKSCLKTASSIAFYFLGNWLQGYYYHVSISPLVFVFADLGAIVLAVTTISFQAIKAALMNPVKSLRTE
jgi:hypothetical protein